ncbi:hypothetical protein DVW07_00675 [Clostridium botulinum]|uniref:hypothetical protein n=1 Tax=Clostridium botulinum TaxID=1491 RepID=UPI00196728FA|nr:hypothetical protein [Clostridium botulinum]MBN1040602.1 hypothetical protein [Clostridium botulinum]
MDNELEMLKKENGQLREVIKDLQERICNMRKNPKGAGRTPKFNAYEISNIKIARKQGKTLKEISLNHNCSIGLIHKIINQC